MYNVSYLILFLAQPTAHSDRHWTNRHHLQYIGLWWVNHPVWFHYGCSLTSLVSKNSTLGIHSVSFTFNMWCVWICKHNLTSLSVNKNLRNEALGVDEWYTVHSCCHGGCPGWHANINNNYNAIRMATREVRLPKRSQRDNDLVWICDDIERTVLGMDIPEKGSLKHKWKYACQQGKKSTGLRVGDGQSKKIISHTGDPKRRRRQKK